MILIFRNLILLTIVLTVSTAFAQEPAKTPKRKVLTIQGDTNRPPPPPPPLIYKAPEKSELKDFVADDKTFRATFPGVPQFSRQKSESAVVTNYRVYRKGSNSVVTVIDFDYDVEGAREKIYENERNHFLKLPNTVVQAERDFQTDGRTGREFDVLQNYFFHKIRVLVVGARVYEIKTDATNLHVVGEKTKKEFADETDRFFNSFKHLKAPEKIVAPAPAGFMGAFKNATYRNDFFKFSVDFPDNWHRLGDAEIKMVKEVGSEILKTDSEKTNKAFAESAEKEVVLFALIEGNFINSNGSSIALGVLKQPSAVVTNEQVMAATKSFFLRNPKMKLVEEVGGVRINGTAFATVTFETSGENVVLNQKILTTLRNNFSLTFVLAYRTPDELKTMEKILATLKFDAK